MKLISHSGYEAFLLEIDEGRGVVLDVTGEPTVSQISSIESLLVSGYWEPFEGDSARIEELAWQVVTEGEELPSAGWDVAGGARRLPGIAVRREDLEGPSVNLALNVFGVYRQTNATFVFPGVGVWKRARRTAGV
jgi:hypothetical protein